MLEDDLHGIELQKTHEVDLLGQGLNGWNNHAIEAFLVAVIAWGEATDMGASQEMMYESTWKRMAEFLYAG